MPAPSIRHLASLLVVGSAWLVSAGPQSTQTPAKPVFSVSVDAVPIDVRVLDRKTGRPVNDLKAADFTILEDGVRQVIRHFELQTLAADEPPRAGSMPAATGVPKFELRESPLKLVPQKSRVFLFVLGNGRLQGGPAKGLDAVIDFIRHRLLPQDHVAVFAYNRATDFTLDHEKVAQVVERFRAENDAIYAGIRQQMSGLAAIYGSREIPKDIQRRVDAVFRGPADSPSRSLDRGENAKSGDRLNADQRRLLEGAADSMVAAGRPSPAPMDLAGSAAAAVDPLEAWGAFDDFAFDVLQTMQDMGNLYASVSYMQKIEGEKHLVYVTANGLDLPRADDYSDLASVAANGRVAVDVVQTGEAGNVTNNKLLRGVADDSGGLASIAETGQAGLARLDGATRSGYLLGYYPANSNWNGTERKIVVKVNRPGVDVAYRRSYIAESRVPNFDRRAYQTRFRIAAAMTYLSEVKDIRIKLNVGGATVGNARGVAIDARIDAGRLHFDLREGVRFGRIEIAVIFMDDRDRIVGGTYRKQTAHLEYTPEAYAMAMRDGVPYQVQMRVPSGTKYIRLMVYDYAADLLGTAGAWLN
jgi:VWFA-related protein